MKYLALAMKNFNEVDHSKLLGCLDNLDYKWLPNQENIGRLLEDLGHKEIIQKPIFIINQWHSVLKDIISPQHFEGIYAKQKNLPDNIIKILNFDENLEETEKITAGYLKKFVRGDEKLLSNFLRYTTGAYIIIGRQIRVSFVDTEASFGKTPVAHTCSCSLILPSNYESYLDFRN
ncbi:hypothetical protein JTB14_011653 [Gonioctena quinquepunctata]|nr:hypothetical protein JTB14_011653 [Gonioctena quinquepunctata]